MWLRHDGSTLALPEVRGAPTASVHLLSIASGESSDPQTPFEVSSSQLLSMNTFHLGFRSTAFSRDGKYCATGSQNGTLILWDLSTTVPTRVYQKEFKQKELDQILFSTDDRLLFVRHNIERCLRTLDRATGEELALRESDIRGMVILPEDRLLLAEVSHHVVVKADSLEPVGERFAQEILDVQRPDSPQVITAQSGESIAVVNAARYCPERRCKTSRMRGPGSTRTEAPETLRRFLA